ncbi:hypothetical protein LTR78_004526 [Recurvomyces mirabilis]|uniref:Uncharacterized protein n=1 Tax=Recurvomyces mirabilis TaxID=574656 RepID=A0AAE1C2G3_9PEZI|nr:hypothetical protein LTR78_004526 [Recurvomyces mirabilis]KAK5152980.1 hypothetical protein LTS14_008088 [Recurvomyces mirabilis]
MVLKWSTRVKLQSKGPFGAPYSRICERIMMSMADLVLVDAAAWAKWLAENASSSQGVWLSMAKKGVTQPTSLTLPQALDEALCYGWINGQGRKGCEGTTVQRWTPRRPKSMWSQVNVEHVARLDQEGRMKDAGWAAVEAAKSDGRWDAAYARQSEIVAPDDLLAAIKAVPEAQNTWEAVNKTNRFLLIYRLSSLKTEAGRKKRIAATVESLAKGETPQPQKGLTTKPTTKASSSESSSGVKPTRAKQRKDVLIQRGTRSSSRTITKKDSVP